MTEQNEKSATSPVYAIACILGLISYVALVARIPMPFDGIWPRIGIGFATLCGGGLFYLICGHFIALVLKAIVEISAAVLLFLNGAYFLWIWSDFQGIKGELVAQEVVPADQAAVTIIIGTVIAAAVANCLAFLILYPLSKTVGTSIVDQ